MTCIHSRRPLLAAALAASLAVLAPGAFAQTAPYPNKPITLIVPFSPGGFTDVVARAISDGLAKSLGQSVVIDNKPGAGSTLGADFVAKAAPDGYTLLMISTTHVISPSMYPKLPYDTYKAFVPVGKLVEGPYVMVVNEKVPVKNVKEIIDLAKSKPGSIDYSSSGNGSSQHLMAAMFGSMAGLKMNHIPYRGSGQSVTDLAAKRSPQLPEVPTLAEAGVTGYDATIWLGLLAPAGTPAAIVTRLNAELSKVLNTPETKAAILATGVEVSLTSPAEFGKLMETEGQKWGQVVRDVGAKVE